MPEFTAKIMILEKGTRFLITVPKKLVDSKVIDPSIPYLVKLEEAEVKI